MKRKADFVTNSSSTSFIIASHKDTPLKVKMEIEVDLSKLVRQTYGSMEELMEGIKEGYFPASEYGPQMIKAIEEGKVVRILDASDESCDDLEAFLCHNGIESIDSDQIRVIFGKGGY